MKAVVVPASAEHIAPIAGDARAADTVELWAQARTTPEDAMRRGMKLSALVFTGLIDDAPVCMFGATPYSMLAGQGVAWMVGSNGLNPLRAQKALLRESKQALGVLLKRYPLLFNAVDDRNEATKRWLRWMGAVFLEPVPIGHDGELFRPFFIKGNPDV